VDANVKQAMRLHDLAERHPSFIPATKPVMSAVCLRYQPPGVDDERLLATLHVDVARRVEESGRFWISTTRMKDKAWFRVNPVNLNTRTEDMDTLFAMLTTECDRALATMKK
jgi:glutamate/tyrosine decarboxylase-like PLP-dependent enzyme